MGRVVSIRTTRLCHVCSWSQSLNGGPEAFKNRYAAFLQDYYANSPLQQGRTALAEFDVAVPNLGEQVPPVATRALRDVDSFVKWINDHIPSTKTLADAAHIGSRIIEGAVGGAIAGGPMALSVVRSVWALVLLWRRRRLGCPYRMMPCLDALGCRSGGGQGSIGDVVSEACDLECIIAAAPAFTADGLASKRRVLGRAEFDDDGIIDVALRLDAGRSRWHQPKEAAC